MAWLGLCPLLIKQTLSNRKGLGSYATDSSTFIKDIKDIAQSYSHDVYMILTNNLVHEGCR